MDYQKFYKKKPEPSVLHNTFDKEKLIKYLIWTFVLAWAIQSAAYFYAMQGNQAMFTLVMAGCMFTPMIGCLFAGVPLKGMGFKPVLRDNLSNVLIALWGPLFLFAIGAGIYFLVFRSHFTTGGEYILMNYSEEVVAQLEEKGVSIGRLILVQTMSVMLYAPFINMFLAIGEEAGWRGFMYPQLKACFGVTKGRIIGGVIWGVWHYPIIILVGYEYGTEYIGAPVLGLVVFTLFTIVWGIILDFIYERAGYGIWFPALMHGAINGAASYGLLFILPKYIEKYSIFGPGGNGLIAMIPAVFFALEICKMEQKRAGKQQ